MSSRMLGVAAIATLGVALVAAAALLVGPTRLTGSVIDPPLPVADFRLTDHTGQPFELSAERNNVTLLFFGFTNCPDECPLTMAHLKRVMQLLEEDAERTTVILVTTDPDRDTPRVLGAFLGRFDERFVGLTGARGELAVVWRDYGVSVMDGGETHSSYIYVIDTKGNLVETVLSETEPADLAADVRILLAAD